MSDFVAGDRIVMAAWQGRSPVPERTYVVVDARNAWHIRCRVDPPLAVSNFLTTAVSASWLARGKRLPPEPVTASIAAKVAPAPLVTAGGATPGNRGPDAP